MADLDYYGADYGAEEPSRLTEALRSFGFVNWAGAVTSLGLTAAVAVWAVDVTFRDVSGVPVIRALEGPMRVAPENPGGTVAPFQGMALSDITSGGAAAPAPDQIVLAPPPVSLEAPSLAERRAAFGVEEEPDVPVRETVAEADEAPLAIRDGDEIDVAALVNRIAQDAEPLDEIVGASAPSDIVLDSAAISQEPSQPLAAVAPVVTGPGIARSARPSQRPAGLRRVAAVQPASPVLTDVVATASIAASSTDTTPVEAPVEQVASVGGLDVDPATIIPGTRVVQLGAYDSAEAARGEWDRLYGRFRDYMDGKQRLVQKARSGGRDFWRLRVVGFDDGSEARRFCSALLAKDAACIPVTVR